MKRTIITVSGIAESGKDTFANILAFHFRTNKFKVLRLNFADWLKKIMEKLIDYKEEDKKNFRTELQRIGTDVIRSKNENYWVDTAIGAFDVLGNEADVMIISDARFENEIHFDNWENKFNVINILVKREKENSLTDEQKTHLSETGLNNVSESSFNYIVDNNKTINDLYYLANKIQKEIMDKYME